MAWNAVWSQTELSIDDVNQLLADLCNAINERIYVIGGTKIDFTTFSGTSQSPSASDFVGMPVMDEYGSWYEVCGQIRDGINRLFSTNTNWWKTSGFEAQYTRAEILTAIGYVEGDLSLSAWRTQNFYRAAKAMMPYARYRKVSTSESYTSLDYLESDPFTGAESPNTISDAWDDATDFVMNVNVPTYYLRCKQVGFDEDDTFFYQVRKTSDNETTITISIPTRASSGTVIDYEARVYVDFGFTSLHIELGTITGDFAGESFSFDLSLQNDDSTDVIIFSDSSPTLSVDITSPPFSIPDITALNDNEQVSFGFNFGPELGDGIRARMDLSPAYTYP